MQNAKCKMQNERLKPKIQIMAKIQKLFGVNPSGFYGVNPSGFHLGVNPLGFHWLTGLVMLAVVLCLPKFTHATPTTNLLITDKDNHRVIEVAPNHNVVWQYGQIGVSGTGTNQLDYPLEAVQLTNGNVLIADFNGYRVIEVRPTGTSGGTILWEYKGPGGSFMPIDVKKLPNGNVLIVNNASYNEVFEVTPVYPDSATIVWRGGTEPNINLSNSHEAEKRGTNSYLITDSGHYRVIEVQANGTSGGTIIWQYGDGTSGTGINQLIYPVDAHRLICNTILITDVGLTNSRVIEVSPNYITGTGGTIVWECSASTGLSLNEPYEAIRMSNWNTLITDRTDHRVIEVRTGDYPDFGTASIVWQQAVDGPVDVEELGIVNIAKAEYQNYSTGKTMTTKFAGIALPLSLPTVNWPEIELSKDGSYIGSPTVGTTLTYTITYHNVGFGTAKNVMITDMIPDGTEYVVGSAKVITGPSATIDYSYDGGMNFAGSGSSPVTHIRWSIAEVAPLGGGGTLEFQVVIK